ncbi:hypothetical protein K523DRAFT_375961 [Schizophyllum commune Tattone D]|nr:hypothetical protein K523DRAFT_375961 [Schizophyllum commune Tattone D]
MRRFFRRLRRIPKLRLFRSGRYQYTEITLASPPAFDAGAHALDRLASREFETPPLQMAPASMVTSYAPNPSAGRAQVANLAGGIDSVWSGALEKYQRDTGNDLLAQDSAPFTSAEALSVYIESNRHDFERLGTCGPRWLQSRIVPLAAVLQGLCAVAGDSVGMVFPPGKIVFTALGFLIKAVVAAREDIEAAGRAIDTIYHHLRAIAHVSNASTPPILTEVCVEVLCQVLVVLGIIHKLQKDGALRSWVSSLGRAGEVKTELAILEDRARSLREAMLAVTVNKVQEIEILLYSIDQRDRGPPIICETVRVMDEIAVTSLDDHKRLVALREARAFAHRRSLENSILRGSPAADVYVRTIIRYYKMTDIDLATPDAQFLDSPAALSRLCGWIGNSDELGRSLSKSVISALGVVVRTSARQGLQPLFDALQAIGRRLGIIYSVARNHPRLRGASIKLLCEVILVLGNIVNAQAQGKMQSWLNSVESTENLTSALEDFSQLVSKTPGLIAIIACDAVEKMLALLAREVVSEDETHELFDLCFKRVGQIWWEVDTDGTEDDYSFAREEICANPCRMHRIQEAFVHSLELRKNRIEDIFLFRDCIGREARVDEDLASTGRAVDEGKS